MWAILIIVIAIVVCASKKQQQTNKNREKHNSNEVLRQHAEIYHSNQTSQSSIQKKHKMNQQTASAFWQNQTNAAGGQKEQGQSEEIYASDKSEMSEREILEAAGVDADDGAILAAAKVHSFMTELDNDSDSQEDLMLPVYDLMIKGPDTSITFERDFVGEATDMLNSIQPDGAIDECCLETTDFDSPYVI